jgi:phytanoyl-CoA hydroxylase
MLDSSRVLTVADRAEVVRHFETHGFAVIRNVIDPELISEADQHVRWLIARYPQLRPEHLHHPLIRRDAFWVRLVTDTRILDVVEWFLGRDIACFTAHYICKPALDGQPVLWHQDGAYCKLEPPEALAVWLAIDATTPENGCLQMIPGSHRSCISEPDLRLDPPNMLYSESPRALVAHWQERAQPVNVLLQPGDVSIHHPHTLHRSGPNISSARRCGLDMGFIGTSTHVTNQRLYLDPILARGPAVPGINTYMRWPLYDPAETIRFNGCERWDDIAHRHNASPHCGLAPDSPEGSMLENVQHMIHRLQEGTVKG